MTNRYVRFASCFVCLVLLSLSPIAAVHLVTDTLWTPEAAISILYGAGVLGLYILLRRTPAKVHADRLYVIAATGLLFVFSLGTSLLAVTVLGMIVGALMCILFVHRWSLR